MDYCSQKAKNCSSTPRLPPWRTLNLIIPQPREVSSPSHDFIDVMWTPGFVLLKSSFVNLLCSFVFSVRTCRLTWRWVDRYSSSMAFPHHATVLCVPVKTTGAECNTVFLITSPIILQSLLLSASQFNAWNHSLFCIISFAWSSLTSCLFLYFSLNNYILQHPSLT